MHGTWGSKGFAAVVAAVAALVFAAPALADHEPNDVISQAEGPIGGGAPITGTLPTGDDVDYYVFYAASQQQLHLTVQNLTDPSNDCIEDSFSDTNGSDLPDDYTTDPGVNRYFFWIKSDGWCDTPTTYRFEIDPGSAVVGGPALDRALVPTGEPNETPGQAMGPIAANVNYIGRQETDNDQDWFWFWVPAGTHQFNASVTQPTGGDCEAEIALYDSPSGSDDYTDSSAVGRTDYYGHISVTLAGPAVEYLRAGSEDFDAGYCTGTPWQFRIESPDAVTGTNPFPPPPPPPPPPPKVTKYRTVLRLHRHGGRFSGRVLSSKLSCERKRRVSLRRLGSSRSFGHAKSGRRGAFTIRHHGRLRGWVYVTVATRKSGPTVCRSSRSRRIRG